jgi:N-acetylmuramoyl-L-alanine amidase
MSETLVVAKTIYGEARGEGIRGMVAVACVIRNRVQHPRVRWWGTGWIGVCTADFQFSCWNVNDPNRRLLESIPEFGANARFPGFDRAYEIAREFVDPPSVPDTPWPDITNRADHYHTVMVNPNWADGRKPVARIGTHIFYRLH